MRKSKILKKLESDIENALSETPLDLKKIADLQTQYTELKRKRPGKILRYLKSLGANFKVKVGYQGYFYDEQQKAEKRYREGKI
jgi:hypothetical protein